MHFSAAIFTAGAYENSRFLSDGRRFRGAHPAPVLVIASSRSRTFLSSSPIRHSRKESFGETPKATRQTRVLPNQDHANGNFWSMAVLSGTSPISPATSGMYANAYLRLGVCQPVASAVTSFPAFSA